MDIGGNPSALFDKSTGKLLLQVIDPASSACRSR
jgi:hypothetical protein